MMSGPASLAVISFIWYEIPKNLQSSEISGNDKLINYDF